MTRRGNKGGSELARVIDGHARKRARSPFPATDLGTIRSGLTLELDSFPIKFPADGYLVGERFTDGKTRSRSGGSGEATFAAHDHEQAPVLAPGDRVVCVILNHDSDSPTPVVVERL